jgi:hypothetical protein
VADDTARTDATAGAAGVPAGESVLRLENSKPTKTDQVETTQTLLASNVLTGNIGWIPLLHRIPRRDQQPYL